MNRIEMPEDPNRTLTYTDLDGETYSEVLEAVSVSGILLHATPDDRVERIRREGLRTGMPPVKLFAGVDAIFCTVPSDPPNTADLFRYYDDWSIVVIDTDKLPDHTWYADIFAGEDPSSRNGSRHLMTFDDIPPEAIRKVVK